MFPTQVPDWQTQDRVGSAPIGKGSSFDVHDPLEDTLTALGGVRDAQPSLGNAWSVVRYAKGGVLVVSRIDPLTKQEYVAAFNNTRAAAGVAVTTATPSAGWKALYGTTGGIAPPRTDASARLSLVVPALGAVLLKADATVPVSTPAKPKLVVKGDGLTSMWAASATVAGRQPVSVAFVVRRASGADQRLDIDTSPPFRGFLDPSKFKRNERVRVIATARSLDGRTATSSPVQFRVRAR
jgi:hypothetical protein